MYTIRARKYKLFVLSRWHEVADLLSGYFDEPLKRTILLALLKNGGAMRISKLNDFVHKYLQKRGFKYPYNIVLVAVKQVLCELEEMDLVVVLDGAVGFSRKIERMLRRRRVKEEDYDRIAVHVQLGLDSELTEIRKHSQAR